MKDVQNGVRMNLKEFLDVTHIDSVVAFLTGSGVTLFVEWFRQRGDKKRRGEERRDRQLDREDEFQRSNLLELQRSLQEATAAVGRFLTSEDGADTRRTSLEQATEFGRRCDMYLSRVSDDEIRTTAEQIATQLANALDRRQVQRLGIDAEWVDTVNAVRALVARIGTTLRQPRSLAVPGASVTSQIATQRS